MTFEVFDPVTPSRRVLFYLGKERGARGFSKLIMGIQVVHIDQYAFPDVPIKIEDIVTEGDKVAVHWSARGTHRGTFMGMPATNKSVTTEGIDIIRYEDGKRVESWGQWDALGLLQQLGVVPAPR